MFKEGQIVTVHGMIDTPEMNGLDVIIMAEKHLNFYEQNIEYNPSGKAWYVAHPVVNRTYDWVYQERLKEKE